LRREANHRQLFLNGRAPQRLFLVGLRAATAGRRSTRGKRHAMSTWRFRRSTADRSHDEGMTRMTGSPVFLKDGDTDWIDAGNGVSRKILTHQGLLMMVRFRFEKGGVGAAHSHPHVQCSYVASGRFEMTIDGDTRIIEAGDSYIVPSNVIHSAVALEAGELIDAFTPARQDFLSL
jgi:quercetin dioxygenase-like cupin family protein